MPQISLPVYNDSSFSTYYHQRLALFKSLPQTKGDIIFIGNSITDGSEWSELFNDVKIKNRGISGDISAGIIKRMDEVVKRKPSKVFLMIGTNDLARGIAPDSVVKNILLIADYLKEQSPSTKLFVQSILPVNAVFGKFGGHTSKAEQIKQVNENLEKQSAAHHYSFIDLYSSFCNSEGKLDARFSNDGLHLLGEGYLLWKHLVYPYVYDLQQKPSLVPKPQQLKWGKGFFALYNCRTILVNQKGFERETEMLQDAIRSFGWNISVKDKVTGDEKYIELRVAKLTSPAQHDEAYKIDVSENKILLTANTAHGIFNAIQT